MLDIEVFRDDPDVVRESLQRREMDPAAVDEVIALDEDWRDALQRLEDLRAKRNRVGEEIAEVKREGGDAEDRIEEMSKIKSEIAELEDRVDQLKADRDEHLRTLPNILHEDVPKGDDEEDNVPIDHWPDDDPDPMPEGTSHVDLLDSLDVGDVERAAKVAGSRFYYLKRDLVRMDLALQRFALDQMVEQGYTPIEPPFMLRREAVEGATDLAAFEDVIYKIEDEDLHLIATSEHAIGAMHMDEIVPEDELPIRYVGVSPCFRKEAGAHGKDTKGIWRVHQFNKVEQFIFCEPEDSWDLHDELLDNAESIMQALEIPYRVVDICTGDIGAVAARKYDIEAWMPVQDRYREVVSASNCTGYQARRFMIRSREAPGEPTYTLHTLNATACATQRTMVAIMENHQRPDGSVEIPEVLRPYMDGQEVIEVRGGEEE